MSIALFPSRFAREARTLAALNHSNIVQISTGGGNRPQWQGDGKALLMILLNWKPLR